MERNLGFNDYLVRMVLTTIILAFAATQGYTNITLAIILAAVGVVVYISALAGWCPIYKAVGVNTCANKIEKGDPA
jgi:hypothetical protein